MRWDHPFVCRVCVFWVSSLLSRLVQSAGGERLRDRLVRWDSQGVANISLTLSTDHCMGVGTWAIVRACRTDRDLWSYTMYCPVRFSTPMYIPALHLVIAGPMPPSLERALYLHICPKGMRRIDSPDPLAHWCPVRPSVPPTRILCTLDA